VKRSERGCVARVVMGCALAVALAGCGGFFGGQFLAEEGMPKAVPDRFAGFDAVVLHDVGWIHHHPYLLQRDLPITFVFTRWTRVKLQQASAAEPGRFGIFKVIHLDDLLEAQASVKKADGRVVALGPADIKSVALVRNYYPDLEPPLDLNETSFIFPGLEAGDVLELRTTEVGWPTSWVFHWRDVPVLLSRIIVTRPNTDLDLQLSQFDPDKVIGKVEEATVSGSAQIGGSEEQLAWTARELAPLPDGDFRVPLVARRSRLDVQISARAVKLEEWAQAYRRWLFSGGQSPAELVAKAKELTQGAADERERARRLLAFVRHELAPQVDDGLTWVWPERPPKLPHPERWLADKQGTPERSVGLLAALLQGIDVQPTLVLTTGEDQPTLNEANRSLQQFRRLLLALPDGTLLDAGARGLGLGQVSPELQGRPALWVAPDKTWFAKLPELGPAENALEAQIEGSVSPEGELGAELKVTLRGLTARDWRLWLASAGPEEVKAGLAPRLLAGWGPRAVVVEQRVEGAEDQEQPLLVTLRYRLPGIAERQGEKLVVKLGALWVQSQVPALTAAERAEPVWLARALSERTEVILELPKELAPVELPKGLRTEPAAAGQTMSVEAELEYSCSEGLLRMSRRIGLNQRAFGADFYPTLRAITSRYLAAANDLLVMQPARPVPLQKPPAPRKPR